MYGYIVDMLEEIPEDTKTEEVATPAVDNLFTINKDNPENMSQEDTIAFHHVTEKLFYLDKSARPDLQLGEI